MPVFTPSTAGEVAAFVNVAAAEGRRLEVRGGGTMGAIRLPGTEAECIVTRGLVGVVDYDPSELTLTVRPGTLLCDVEELIAGEGQMLAFDPFDYGAVFNDQVGRATLGGILAAGVSGSRRVSAGAARDHILRVEAVSGRGEIFVAGAKVVKNVTGYDLPKLMSGSWGRLAALTEITLKVLPRPQCVTTLAFRDLSPNDARSVMLQAMASTASVAAAAHIPGLWGERAVTGLRLEGVEPSIRARTGTLAERLRDFGGFDVLDAAGADDFWNQLRQLGPLANGQPLWRVHLPAQAWVDFVGAVSVHNGRWMIDWAGSLVWLATEAPAATIRHMAQGLGGHAMMVRRGPLSGAAPIFHQQARPVIELERRLRRAFDPRGVFETGRFGDCDAN